MPIIAAECNITKKCSLLSWIKSRQKEFKQVESRKNSFFKLYNCFLRYNFEDSKKILLLHQKNTLRN